MIGDFPLLAAGAVSLVDGAQADNENASCHDHCSIVAINTARDQNHPVLTGSCHDNCNVVGVNQAVNKYDSSCHNNCVVAAVHGKH